MGRSPWREIVIYQEPDEYGDGPSESFFADLEAEFPNSLNEGFDELAKVVTRAGGSPLKVFRIRAGLSQCELAKLAGVTQDAISTMENKIESRNPTRAVMVKIITALNLTPQESWEAFFS